MPPLTVHEVEHSLTIRCNAGKRRTNLRGTMSGYGEMWLYEDGIANILLLSRVKDKFRITYDSTYDNAFHVYKPEKTIVFKEAPQGLYYFDTAEREEYGEMLVNTVAGNKSKYSAYDYSQAKLARALQKRVGRPYIEDFKRYIRDKEIPDCPVIVQDVSNAEHIFGSDLGTLKGKTVWTQPSRVKTEVINIPRQIMLQYKKVCLSIDVMKVNSIPFY